MSKTGIAPGETVDFTLTGSVAAGDPIVVAPGILGIAVSGGVSGDVIAVWVGDCIHWFTAASSIYAYGDIVHWDASGTQLAKGAKASGDFDVGMVVETPGGAATRIKVLKKVPAAVS